MEDFIKEFAEDFLAFSVKKGSDISSYKIGVRIGNPVLRHAIDKLPEYSIKNTKYNRQTLKWFRFERIDVGRREIIFYSRLRIMKFTDKIWLLSGTWCTYDNAWDVFSGLNLEVSNRSISGDVRVHNTVSDWPSGLGGVFISLFDAFTGSMNWVFSGKFTTISDVIGSIATLVFNLSDAGNITGYLATLDDLNQRGLIYLDKTDYDPKGFWQWYKVDPSRLDEAIQKIQNCLSHSGWL